MITFKKYLQVIEEGGAYGHMANMYEDTDLTFNQLRELTSGLFDKTIKADFKEKTDGQALAVTMKPTANGEVKAFFGRNAGHVKNGSETALTVDEVKDKFQGRGDLADAFIYSAVDISNALESLPLNVQESIFLSTDENNKGNWGYRWLHIEIVWPKTANVIPYGESLKKLIIHNYTEHNATGEAIGSDFNQTAEYLVDELRKIKNAEQEHFVIDFMPLIKPGDIKRAGERSAEYISYFNNLQNQYGLSDTNTVGDLYEEIYKAHILSKAEEFGFSEISDDILNLLVNRWVYAVKQPSVTLIKNQIPNEEFKNWVANHDKTEHKTWSELNVRNVIKIPFIRIAIDILSGMSELWMAADKEGATENIRQRIDNTISHFKELEGITDDIKTQATVDKINKEMEYVTQTGGLDNIMPTEGLTFLWNDKVYKLTGTFAPVNQILGQDPGRFAENVSRHLYTPAEGKSFNDTRLTGILGPQ
jgi:hypothetical protein